MIAFLVSISDSAWLKMIVIPLLFLAAFVNLVFSVVLYYLNNKVSVFVSVGIFLISAWLLRVINKNFDEFSNYENWQFYNHQQIISTKLDLIIGKNLDWFQFYLALILLNIFSGFYCIFNKLLWRKKK
jgi:Na+/phosphate symporter